MSKEQNPALQAVGCEREPELRIIHDLLRRSKLGVGGVVLVEGEAGAGKSYLVREAIRLAREHGFCVASAAFDQLGQTRPLFALCEELEEPSSSQTSGNYDNPNDDGRAVSRLRMQLQQRAATAPVLVCLDDLQWASPVTLTALRTLTPGLRGAAVGWVLARTNTADHHTEDLFDLLQSDGAACISLTPFDDETVADLLTRTFRAPPDDELLDFARGTGGNAELFTELVLGLRDDLAVQVTDERAVLVSRQLPRRVHRIAQRRLDRLSKQTRNLLMTVSVLGSSFRLEDAAEMLGKPPAALLPLVEEAMSARMLTAADSAFLFSQELVRTALSDVIPGPARQALHRHYGRLLLKRGGSCALAADHLVQGAHPRDPASLADLDTAAEQVLPDLPQSAADLALRALELTPPGDPLAQGRVLTAAETLAAAGRVQEAAQLAQDALVKPLPLADESRMRCVLSSVLIARGRAKEATDQAAIALAQPQIAKHMRDQALTAHLLALTRDRNGPGGHLGEIVLAERDQHDVHTRIAALAARAAAAWATGQAGETVEILRDAARHGKGISPDARHPQPLLALVAALVDLRQLDEAKGILQAAERHMGLSGAPVRAAIGILRARIQLADGDLPDASESAQAALVAAQSVGADAYIWTARGVLAAIALRRGRLATAEQQLSGVPAPMAHYPTPYARTETCMARALIIEARDGPVAAMGLVRDAARALPAGHGTLLSDPAVAPWFVRTSLAAGDESLATYISGIAVALADKNRDFPALAAAAAHSKGLASRNIDLLAEATALHPDTWARASAAEDLAVLLEGAVPERAVKSLKLALERYDQIGAERDSARVRRRLRKLGIRRRHWATLPARPVSGWASLTGTERTIAALVAEGLNNQQVAARVFLSTHTVAHHLRQTFRKLQITSRVELARIFLEESTEAS